MATIRSLSRDPSARREEATESDPLLGGSLSAERAGAGHAKKPWRRPRPMWLVPFAVTAALSRSMTLAPRTQVFTELACSQSSSNPRHQRHTPCHTTSLDANCDFPNLYDIEAVPFGSISPRSLANVEYAEKSSTADDDIPLECLTDPSVQAGAAKMQTLMTTTMGLLSALTTGWWGHFGDRHGRTKVIPCAIAGLLFTDLMFIIASNPPKFLGDHAYILLVIAPIVEGLLGGWTTLQSAIFAYISDCTSHGSRAHVFSRFSGSFFIGIAFGPEIAALILHNTHNVTTVFYTSSGCALVNLILALTIFPESLSKDVRARNIELHAATRKTPHVGTGKTAIFTSAKNSILEFVRPLKILGPRRRAQGRGGRDWSMTLLALVLFCHFLTLGLFQIKYLYAEHMFSWTAEQLSYYITVVGSGRALHLILILPTIIRFCKPGSPPIDAVATAKGKGVPSLSTLSADIKFDMLLAKFSLGIDLLSQVLVIVARDASQPQFVVFSSISGFGTGVLPALQSVAMSLSLLAADQDGHKGGDEVGKLFGAIAVVQAVGSMILGPMIFGTVYGLTVGPFPKGIFLVAATLLLFGSIFLSLIRRPRLDVSRNVHVDTQVEEAVEQSRGRSRKSKDIRQYSS